MTDLTQAEPNRATRIKLAQAGLDTTDWSDRHLLSVEVTAKALHAGERIFVSEQMRLMVSALIPTRSGNLRT